MSSESRCRFLKAHQSGALPGVWPPLWGVCHSPFPTRHAFLAPHRLTSSAGSRHPISNHLFAPSSVPLAARAPRARLRAYADETLSTVMRTASRAMFWQSARGERDVRGCNPWRSPRHTCWRTARWAPTVSRRSETARILQRWWGITHCAMARLKPVFEMIRDSARNAAPWPLPDVPKVLRLSSRAQPLQSAALKTRLVFRRKACFAERSTASTIFLPHAAHGPADS